MGYAIVLSGQGSEKVGMFNSMLKDSQKAIRLLEQIEDLTHRDIKEIIGSNNPKEIMNPQNNQILIFLFHTVMSSLVMEEMGEAPSVILGHSLGQICSLGITGALKEDETLSFILKRTEIINDEDIEIKAKFKNVFGITRDELKKVIEQNELDEHLKIALHNQQTQIVVAADQIGEKELIRLIDTYRYVVKDMTVSRPYHTTFMKEYNSRLLPHILKLNMNDAKIPILHNYSKEYLTKAEDILDELKIQMVKCVNWYDSILKVDETVDKFIIMDPSGGQTKIISKISNKSLYNISNIRNIKVLK